MQITILGILTLHVFSVLAPVFAPMRDSEAFCSTKFIKALTECGAQITVIVYAKRRKLISIGRRCGTLCALRS